MPLVFDNPNHYGSGFYFDDPSETSSGSGGGGGSGVNMTAQSLLVKQGWIKAGDSYVGDDPDGSSSHSGGTPALSWSAPAGLSNGNTLTINTDGTYSFGAKAHAKPLLYWDADGGQEADLVQGRKNWDYPSNPIPFQFSTDIVAPNSTQSVVHDHFTGDKALEWVYTTGQRDLVVFRKVYEDFSVNTDYAMRTRGIVTSGDPATIAAGMTVTGATSGATGVVAWTVTYDTTPPIDNWEIFYNQTDGTINDEPPVDFIQGEVMTVSNGVTLTNNEGGGLTRTANYKTIRLRNETPGENTFMGTQYWKTNYEVTHEYTASTTQQLTVHQTSSTWLSQLFQIRNSSAANAADAFWKFRENDSAETSDLNYISHEDGPTPHWLAQTQVSNGMQPNSNQYWSTLYVDETLQMVVIGNASTWNACSEFEPQLPTAWTTSNIDVSIRLGTLPPTGNYLYVIDIDGSPVQQAGVLLQ